MTVSVIVPTYNERENISPLITEILTHIPGAEVVVVDDVDLVRALGEADIAVASRYVPGGGDGLVGGGRLVVDCSNNTTGRMRRSVFPHDSGHHWRGNTSFCLKNSRKMDSKL